MKIVNTVCEQCNNLFSQKDKNKKYLKRFCCKSCSASYNNKLTKQIIKQLCKHCNKEFVLSFPKDPKIFCSAKCSADFRFENIINEAKSGKIASPATLKRVLEVDREYKCEICNISEWREKSISLHLDHIDGNADNNSISNLRLLCPNCHSQTETFCGRNKKNTKRSAYNQRYRIKKLKVVGDSGIEPLQPACKTRALPLS